MLIDKDAFSAEDLEIIRLIAYGLKNRQIQELLGCSRAALNRRITNVYEKTLLEDCNLRVSLAVWYVTEYESHIE